MEFKWKSSVFSRAGTVSIDSEEKEKYIKLSPTVDNLIGVAPTIDIDFVLIFISICSLIVTAFLGVGVYHLYDLYVHWYPDHLFHHQRFIETFHLW